MALSIQINNILIDGEVEPLAIRLFSVLFFFQAPLTVRPPAFHFLVRQRNWRRGRAEPGQGPGGQQRAHVA